MQPLLRPFLRPAFLTARAGVEAATIALAAASTKRPPCTSVGWRRASSSTPSEDALRKAERMVELMGQSTQMQQIMMNVLPAPMRNPEVFKQLFGDPATRRRIAEIIATRGISIPDHLLERMSPTVMDQTFARASRLGLDPSQLFTKLMAHPGLLAKLQQPRVMTAFLDISEDPARQAKYADDQELLEVVFKVREIMGTAKSQPAETPSAPVAIELPPPSAEPEIAGIAAPIAGKPPPPGQPPQFDTSAMVQDGGAAARASSTEVGIGSQDSSNPLVVLMRSDPKAARWLDNLAVMAALEEVHKKPWKTVKYVFNRDVMEAFKDLKNLMRGKPL